MSDETAEQDKILDRVEEALEESSAIDPDETTIVKLEESIEFKSVSEEHKDAVAKAVAEQLEAPVVVHDSVEDVVESMAADEQVAEELEKNELSEEALARIEEGKTRAEEALARIEEGKTRAEERLRALKVKKERVAQLLAKQKAEADALAAFEDDVRDLGQDLAEEVFREIRQKPAYDQLSEEEHEILVHVVKRKASVLKAIEMAHKAGNHSVLKLAQASANDLRSIEASLDVLNTLRVREVMKEKMKALALKAVSFALSSAL